MFCGKCGTNNPENVNFCSKCGAQLGNQSAPAPATATAPKAQTAAKKPADTNKIVGIAVVAVIAVVVVVLISSLLGRDYKSTVKQYIKASYTGDGKTIVNLMPKKFVQAALKEEDCKKSDLIDEFNYELANRLNRIGDNWSYTYKIIDVDDIKKDDLKKLKEKYKDDYGINIKASKKVKVEMTILLKDYDYEYNDTIYVPVVKIGSSWYFDIENGRLF